MRAWRARSAYRAKQRERGKPIHGRYHCCDEGWAAARAFERGPDTKNAPYVGQIGPILENAVKVNELEARGKEVRSDLYLGAARMSDGSLMGVRFVVNMYEDGQKVLDADSMEPLRGSLYAHTGRQIKNGTESLKGREVSTNAVALYGSNISIEDFWAASRRNWAKIYLRM